MKNKKTKTEESNVPVSAEPEGFIPFRLMLTQRQKDSGDRWRREQIDAAISEVGRLISRIYRDAGKAHWTLEQLLRAHIAGLISNLQTDELGELRKAELASNGKKTKPRNDRSKS